MSFGQPIPLLFGSFHWLVLVLLQTENFVIYRTPKSQRLQALGRWLTLGPRLQTENLAVACLLGWLARLATANVFAGWVYSIGYVALTGYVLVAQFYYKRFFEHFRPSLIPSREYLSLPWIGSSLRHELDWVFGANVFFAGSGLCGLAICSRTGAEWQGGVYLALAIGGCLLIGAPAACKGGHHHLQRHPFVVLVFGDLRHRRFEPGIANSVEPSSLPEPESENPVDDRLAAALETIRRTTHRPNVILVVLESVGGVQLFGTNELLSPVETPNLEALSRHAVHFPTTYTFSPMSERSYVSLETGGGVPTRGGNWIQAFQAYQGPSLARHFDSQGYRTSLFASTCMTAGEIDKLIHCVGYDIFSDADRDRLQRRNMIHWWGCHEENTLERMNRWIDEGVEEQQPFFLLYWTAATHHPYGAPPDYPAPFAGDDMTTRYRNALHYTDAAIGQLVQKLKGEGLWENTILAITGDHGESFGTFHLTNYCHGASLYEENVRTFLMLVNPAIVDGPVVSWRRGQSCDMLPTLADIAGLPIPEVSGKSLCSPAFPSRFIYFFKTLSGDQWGLRDGRWKFIQALEDNKAELYDLEDDPTEQVNLAGRHVDKVRGYGGRCQEWYHRSNAEFLAKLKPAKMAA